MLKRLLGGTERRRVGGGATQDAHHIGHAHGQHEGERNGHNGAHHDDGEAPHVKLYALMPHQSEEVGTDIQAEGVDKERQSEGLGKIEHLLVGAQVEVSRQDAYEEHEGYA